MRAIAASILILGLAACEAAVPPQHTASGDLLLPSSALSAAVNEYFHLRKLAVVGRDIELLYSRFPELRTGADRERGVNVEAFAARSDSARSLADVIYALEQYERMRATVTGDEAVVRVHGLERYIEEDFSDGTAGEFVIDLYLRRDRDAERWSVVRTDEMTIVEYHGGRQR